MCTGLKFKGRQVMGCTLRKQVDFDRLSLQSQLKCQRASKPLVDMSNLMI